MIDSGIIRLAAKWLRNEQELTGTQRQQQQGSTVIWQAYCCSAVHRICC
ncbi:MAG: hypothetical protein Q7V05_06745 [Methanoregula sp.]|nr:hypothetical protein [Methanoregula sp.]